MVSSRTKFPHQEITKFHIVGVFSNSFDLTIMASLISSN